MNKEFIVWLFLLFISFFTTNHTIYAGACYSQCCMETSEDLFWITDSRLILGRSSIEDLLSTLEILLKKHTDIFFELLQQCEKKEISLSEKAIEQLEKYNLTDENGILYNGDDMKKFILSSINKQTSKKSSYTEISIFTIEEMREKQLLVLVKKM